MEQGPETNRGAKTAAEILGALAVYCQRMNDSWP
jgi:hypothetical protein